MSTMPAYLRKLMFLLAAGLAAMPVSAVRADPPAPPKPHQVVIISFDGDNDIAQWQRSRALAAVTGARFTYFLSCVYVLTRVNRQHYRAPGMATGRSNVGFGTSREDVAARLDQIWLARSEGHDIANHACGHFDGSSWKQAQWRSELDSFTSILRDAYTINELEGEPEGWRHFVDTEILGFRAPYLAPGKNLDAALAAAGYRYNASDVSRGPSVPSVRDGLLQFALPTIPEGPRGRQVIAMDYNLFVRHSGGFERKDEGSVFEDRTVAAFSQAFEKQYRGARVPLQIGFHFTLMNDGTYWRALERFAKDVCLRSDVDCISHADYAARQKQPDPTHTSDVGG